MNMQNADQEEKFENLEESKAALVEKIDRLTVAMEAQETAIPALALMRWEEPTERTSYMHEPSICLIAQGSKRVFLGDDVFYYDANHFLLTSLDLPVTAQIIEASPKKPYLGLMLRFKQRSIAQMMVDSNLPAPRAPQEGRGIAVSELSAPLLSAFHRLVNLLDQPEDIPILAPLIQKEILYRLLVGEQGPRLRHIASVGSQSHQVAKAIDWLKENYEEPLKVGDLAAQTGMSPSTFHHHFRALTAMSPLQFQKWLRLHEARRLMLTDRLDAATASFRVGYESPSQFSREYSRMFGAPPLRDIKKLREDPMAGQAVAYETAN